jgi:hypothetical protein
MYWAHYTPRVPMESEKPPVLDEKNARLLEEMEKSLQKMEQTLGKDHPVVGKILDSYAKLLRKNNLRHLDALNMEARAKAIRAKQNQKEAEAQSIGLTFEPRPQEKKGLTLVQARVFAWALSLLIVVGLGFAAVDIIKKSDRLREIAASRAKNHSTTRTVQIVDDTASRSAGNASDDASGNAASDESGNAAGDAGPPAAVVGNASGSAAGVTSSSPRLAGNAGKPGNDAGNGVRTQVVYLDNRRNPITMQPPPESPAPVNTSQNQISPEVAAKISALKDLAREQLAIGLEAEKEKDYQKATNAYVEVARAAQSAPQQIGRPVYSEEIAQCFEGYARMAVVASHPDIAKEWEQAAVDIRSHSNE